MDRVKTGVVGLDTMLNGVFPTSGADEAAIQADRDRLDDRPEDVLDGGAGQPHPDPIVPPVPRGTRGDDPHRLRTSGPKEARDRVLPRPRGDPDAQVDRRRMIRRALSIEKFRGSAFDDKMHPVTIGDRGMVVALDAPSQIRGTSPEGKPGESLLETRLIDEVSNVIESVMRQIEEAHRRQIPIRDVEVALSRAMLAFQRRNYQKAMKIALACDSQLRERIADAPPPPPVAMPPRLPWIR